MKIVFSEKAEQDLDRMDGQLRAFFFKHVEKISRMPPRRHMKFGLPFNVENVTDQARLVHHIENEQITILRCFDKHKDYEKWYKSFK